MADIPIISITKEGSSDGEDLSASSPSKKRNIEDEHTDTEELIMEPAAAAGPRGKKGPRAPPARPSPDGSSNVSLLEALDTTTAMNGAVTDVEDCSDTSDEDEADKRPAPEVEISLDTFLDQGYVDEQTKSDGAGGAKPKVLTRSSSKAVEPRSAGHRLMVCAEPSGAVTDCEDCDASEEEVESTVPDCPDDILLRVDEEGGATVDIHNSAVRRRQEKHIPRAEPVQQSSSSDSDEPGCKVVRHRKPHRKGAPHDQTGTTSDCENLVMVSDEESGACASRPRGAAAVAAAVAALFEAEEITMEDSDREQEPSTPVYPEINISFVTDDAGPASRARRVNSSRPSSLAVAEDGNPEDAVTDMENLDSSDSESETRPQTGKRLIPRAVARGGRGGGAGGLTDVEDFNTSDEEGEEARVRLEFGQEHSFLPSPTREIAILRGDGSGEQTANVMPLNQPCCLLMLKPDTEQALTDCEDLAVNDGEQLYDDTQYTIEELPAVDNDSVYASENNPRSAPESWLDKTLHEPVTDTEDLLELQPGGKGCGAGGSNELRRRRRPKGQSPAAAGQSFKGKTFLDTKASTVALGGENSENPEPVTTDVEDLYLSEEDEHCFTDARQRSQQRRATIQVPPNQHAEHGGAKTDIEYLSGDEYVSERMAPSPTVCPDGFRSGVRSRERMGGLFGGNPDDLSMDIPTVREPSPIPTDAQGCNTDCEEVQGASDGDEHGGLLLGGAHENESYSRAQTATPMELRRALDESARSEVYDALVGPPRRLYAEEQMLRDRRSLVQDNPTDVEYLDDDPAN